MKEYGVIIAVVSNSDGEILIDGDEVTVFAEDEMQAQFSVSKFLLEILRLEDVMIDFQDIYLLDNEG